MNYENMTAYVGKCHGCGSIIAVVFTGIAERDEVAGMVSEMINDGLIVEPSYDFEFGSPAIPCCEVGARRLSGGAA